jgi:hypothetical protein
MSRSPKLPPGEHRSTPRRRSWRRYNARNAPKVRARALRWYRENHEYCLTKKRVYRRRQHRNVWGQRRVSEAEWADVKHHYQVERAMGNSCTFKQLAARFMISPRRIQRRSSRDGGWSLRFTPERQLFSKRPGRAR